MSNFNSASENADLFGASLIRARKLVDYALATSARYDESFEAVSSLSPNERKPHLGALTELFKLKIDRMLNAVLACDEFLKCADMAPDFAKANLESGIAEIREAHQATLSSLKKLQS